MHAAPPPSLGHGRMEFGFRPRSSLMGHVRDEARRSCQHELETRYKMQPRALWHTMEKPTPPYAVRARCLAIRMPMTPLGRTLGADSISPSHSNSQYFSFCLARSSCSSYQSGLHSFDDRMSNCSGMADDTSKHAPSFSSPAHNLPYSFYGV